MPNLFLAINTKQKVVVSGVSGAGGRSGVTGLSVWSSEPTKVQAEIVIESGLIYLVPQSGAVVGDLVTINFAGNVNGGADSMSGTIKVKITAAVIPPDTATTIDLFADGDPEFLG